MNRLNDAALRHLQMIGDVPDLSHTKYEILEPLGRGGMGSVYLARDRELGRAVALKVVHHAEPADLVARLEQEARILARLEHPGIVPVHDVGTLPDGRAFYTMKLVRGQRLDLHLAATESMAERVRLFERICHAVAFAHAHGVIHRDLKPENVMVGPFGEVLVMDWGVAELVGRPDGWEQRTHSGSPDRESEVTSAGTVVGTAGYMAPEQAEGTSGSVDERSDVFALGAILRFILLGAPPGAEPMPSRAGVATPRPLRAIVRKSMEPLPAARYQSVTELSADLARFQAGLPVEAHREGLLERTGRLVSKYRTPLALILAYVLMRLVLVYFGGQ